MANTLIDRILNSRRVNEADFKVLLSPLARPYLEQMAKRVHQEHLQHFGKAIVLYTPIYLANHCVNQCVYCSYNAKNKVKRHQLDPAEIHAEAQAVAKEGISHVLLLTGESERHTPFSYIKEAVEIMRGYFESITIEVYPLTSAQYGELVALGVDGLTIYQETYDQAVYKTVHPYGPKKDYQYRLEAPMRGAEAGMYHINIGALLGLKAWHEDVYALGMHLKALETRYPTVHYSISVPRIRPFKGQMFESVPISDRDMVQIILALKLFAPRVGINISTRETPLMREHLLPLGVAKMSAGVKTAVGGHSEEKGDAQFDISDSRSVSEIKSMLTSRGYQPVMKDWVRI